MVRELAAQCHCNLALAWLRLAGVDDRAAAELALGSCTAAIGLMPRWEKPLFRRAACYKRLGRFDAALKDLMRAARVRPACAEIAEAVVRVRGLRDELKV